MSWSVECLTATADDLSKLDRSQQIQVLKAIRKVAQTHGLTTEVVTENRSVTNPHPMLAGYCKIRMPELGIRVIYGIVKKDHVMQIFVISGCTDDLV